MCIAALVKAKGISSMKVFVINLDKNVERMSSMKAQLDRFGLVYERFPAIYGKQLSKEDRKSKFSAIRSFFAMGRRLTDGEIGCALSHLGIYHKMCEEDIDIALILEDDILISDGVISAIHSTINFLDISRAQVVLFSALGVNNKGMLGIQRVSSAQCADAYLITKEAARIIIKANFPILTVADCWRRWSRREKLELYQFLPAIVVQDNVKFGTDVANWTSVDQIRRHSFLSLILYKTCRIVEVFFDWLLWKVTGR